MKSPKIVLTEHINKLRSFEIKMNALEQEEEVDLIKSQIKYFEKTISFLSHNEHKINLLRDVKRHGYNKKEINEAEINDTISCYVLGMNCVEISKITGRSANTVRKIVNKYKKENNIK